MRGRRGGSSSHNPRQRRAQLPIAQTSTADLKSPPGPTSTHSSPGGQRAKAIIPESDKLPIQQFADDLRERGVTRVVKDLATAAGQVTQDAVDSVRGVTLKDVGDVASSAAQTTRDTLAGAASTAASLASSAAGFVSSFFGSSASLSIKPKSKARSAKDTKREESEPTPHDDVVVPVRPTFLMGVKNQKDEFYRRIVKLESDSDWCDTKSFQGRLSQLMRDDRNLKAANSRYTNKLDEFSDAINIHDRLNREAYEAKRTIDNEEGRKQAILNQAEAIEKDIKLIENVRAKFEEDSKNEYKEIFEKTVDSLRSAEKVLKEDMEEIILEAHKEDILREQKAQIELQGRIQRYRVNYGVQYNEEFQDDERNSIQTRLVEKLETVRQLGAERILHKLRERVLHELDFWGGEAWGIGGREIKVGSKAVKVPTGIWFIMRELQDEEHNSESATDRLIKIKQTAEIRLRKTTLCFFDRFSRQKDTTHALYQALAHLDDVNNLNGDELDALFQRPAFAGMNCNKPEDGQRLRRDG